MKGKLLRFPPAGSAAAQEDPASGSSLSSEALVVACGTGDRAALGELFDRFHQTVYRFLSRYLRLNNPDLDDLVQAVFLEVMRAAPRFRSDSAVSSWILGIAVNVARHYVRSEARRNAFLRREDLGSAHPSTTPEALTERAEFLRRIQQAILDLPEHLRAPFVMCEVEGIGGSEAARILNLREGTLWRRLHDARKLIRQSIEGGTV